MSLRSKSSCCSGEKQQMCIRDRRYIACKQTYIAAVTSGTAHCICTLYHIFFQLQTNVRFCYKKSSLHRMHFLIKQKKTPIHFVHITLYKQTGAFSQPAILKRSRYFFFCYPLFI